MTRLNDEQLNALFNEPRTVNAFTEQPVTDEQLQKIYELAAMGPTAFNSQPLRITWVRSPHAKERLLGHLHEGNRASASQAPVNAILAFERNWQKRFPEFAPHAVAAQKFFEDEGERIPLGRLCAQVQAGYFITAVRALGLDVGPITGADFEAITADAVLLGEQDQQPFLVVNIGYGLGPFRERGVRFSFEQTTRTV